MCGESSMMCDRLLISVIKIRSVFSVLPHVCRRSVSSDVCVEVTPGLHTNSGLLDHNRFQSAESEVLRSIFLSLYSLRFSLELSLQMRCLGLRGVSLAADDSLGSVNIYFEIIFSYFSFPARQTPLVRREHSFSG